MILAREDRMVGCKIWYSCPLFVNSF